ncbi:tetratricopeptide repeat protein [Paucihalobacter sp.]|uniref:tetratricopeptide repeat protein n=1 Tax=Paucihalobacter sp. TaxID=2850405 RepID=UPI002FE16D80
MRFLFYILTVLVLLPVVSFGQSDALAEDYFKRGDYEKALITYQKLYDNQKGSTKYMFKIVETLQQLERYQEAKEKLNERLSRYYSPTYAIEMGYNYQLMDSLDMAKEYYNSAIAYIEEKPNFVYTVARSFEDHALTEQAIQVYQRGMELQPEKNYNIQLARLYGDQGDVEGMFTNYIDYIESNPSFIHNAKRAFSDFLSEDSENSNNQTLRKLVLKKLQTTPEVFWYELLSWQYIQERAYSKAFVQEKALYMRFPESLNRLIELASVALDDQDFDISLEVFQYILDNAQDIETQLLAHQYRLDIMVETATAKDYNSIQKNYLSLLESFGKSEVTLALQLSYAKFLAFRLQQTNEASNFLRNTLKLNLAPFQEGSVKMLIADILVIQEKFNEALIYYTQIQNNLKNSTLSQEARFKVAKTSYYKGDFDWAESQLKILKAATSQLIANDALELKLLISDNKYDDSTQTALKHYAKADLLAFQNNNQEAISLLDKILTEHRGESIIDEALYKQAQLFEKEKLYDKAITNYNLILTDYREEILADDAHFRLAEIYNYILDNNELAKQHYEKIIFEHQDSIYFIEARKKFRLLRGDAIN